MMFANVALKTLRDNRRALFWWSFGLVAFVVVNVLFYPDFKDQTEFNKLLDSDALKAFTGNITSFTSPEGYMNAQWFAMVAPILLIIYAVTQGTNLIAGEEGRRTLPLLLANPVSRERIICDKFAALKIGVLLLAAVQLAALAVSGPFFDLSYGFWELASASISLFLLALLYGGIAFLLGAATGNRSLATGVTVTLVAAGYLLNSLAPLVKDLEPFQKYSPFYLYYDNDPLTNGLDWTHAAILAGLILVTFLLSLVAFRRRDVAA